jgi:pilus assembly protein CpaD
MAQMRTPTRSKAMDTRASLRTVRLRLPKSFAAALALALVLPLGACGINRTIAPPTAAYDYHDRHPVALVDADQTLDVFPPLTGTRLDTATTNRLRDFVGRYRRFGHGQITVLAPADGPGGAAAHRSVAEVRRALEAAGVNGSIYVASYPISDPSLSAPIRLSFRGIKAKVADRCGDWPEDLASGSSLEGWQNQTYWNFGCANQATLAAQVEDPRDLVAPRGQTPSDIEMRMRGIGKVRQGEDPTTKWELQNTNISTVGGN